MKKLKSTFLVLLMATICLVVYYGYLAITDETVPRNDSEIDNDKAQMGTGAYPDSDSNTNNNQADEPDNSEVPEKVEISLVVIGDNFAHDSVIQSGKGEDNTYNYDFMFEQIKDYVDSADIAAIFQTMIIAGNDRGLSGYPVFNSPEEMMDSIDKAGFDVALMASTHSNDKGVEGIKDCIAHWRDRTDVLPVGINDKKEEQTNIPMIEVKGKKIALLNYTVNMNNPIEDSSSQYMVNNLGVINTTTGSISDSALSQSVISDITRAKESADAVVVFPYWGNDYSYKASATQKEWAKLMTEAGADIIIGSGSHYIGEIEEIVGDNGNKSFCYYSLGTFCSSFNQVDTMVSGMAGVTIVIDGEEVYVDMENTGMMPLVTHYTHSGVEGDGMAKIDGIYPINLYTAEMASKHGIITRGKVNFSLEIVEKIINDNIKKEYLKKD